METVYCHLSAKRACKTIMRGPVSKKGGLRPFVRNRSFIETQMRPSEGTRSGLELIFREKRASRRYSITTDPLYAEREMRLPCFKEKSPLLPMYPELQESNDISALAESAVEVARCCQRNNEQHSSVSLPTDLETVDYEDVDSPFLRESVVDENQPSEMSSLLQQNNEAVEQVCCVDLMI